ncbi:MAG: MotA/TolQ/ExbB proton channel family protein [Candidatus Omnitrophica bacterium]|nr:MotA/TolQ/ExbB proton channel family protein [Candidatus Omnitrophota bacterium]
MDLYKMSFWQMILAGKAVMWPIILCSVLALAIVLERLRYFKSIKIDTQQFLLGIFEQLKRHQIKEALQLCDKAKHPMAHILKAGILKYDRPRSQIKEVMEDASLYEIPKLEKNLLALATIAHIAPLLGLLGTATGMVRCFQAISIKSAGLNTIAIADLSAGIWEALLTTVAGLVVAIPAYVAYNYLVSLVNSAILEMEKAGAELINFLAE